MKDVVVAYTCNVSNQGEKAGELPAWGTIWKICQKRGGGEEMDKIGSFVGFRYFWNSHHLSWIVLDKFLNCLTQEQGPP